MSAERRIAPLPSPSDADLSEINTLLDWHAGAPLPDGRLLGRLDRRAGKRSKPQPIPDARIRLLNRLIPLRHKRVLEVGCFEGIHTVGLSRYCRRLTAIDVRPSNVIKTLTRLSYHRAHAHVFQWDAECIAPDFPHQDVVFHIGVLYHLMQPVQHLQVLGQICDHVYLDTHIADAANDAICTIEVNGQSYQASYRDEGGWSDPFSGKDARALWLTGQSLEDALSHAGFAEITTLQTRRERNGDRVLLLASRTPREPLPA